MVTQLFTFQRRLVRTVLPKRRLSTTMHALRASLTTLQCGLVRSFPSPTKRRLKSMSHVLRVLHPGNRAQTCQLFLSLRAGLRAPAA
jgi:hypothetical protein